MEKTPKWEDIAGILAIFSLWPAIFCKATLFSTIVLWLALCVTAFITIRRFKRFNRAHNTINDKSEPAEKA